MSISIDISYKIKEEIEKIKLEKKEIKYIIISNVVGKNLILLSYKNKIELEKIKEKLELKFKDYIEEVLLDTDLKDDCYIEYLKEEYKYNTINFTNISYNSWVENNDEIETYDNKNIIAGYSFKGGVGRSQTLAYLSLFYALLNKKVVVLDCDFEAPGISTLLDKEILQKAGIIDFLVDSKLELETPLNLKNYYFQNKTIENLIVFSSGIDNDSYRYIDKISKIDFNSEKFIDDIKKLIVRIKKEIEPDYIFIDLRAGINESNGYFLKKIADKSLLFFTGDSQNKIGMEIIIKQLEESNVNNYYIVNSLIRDYHSEILKEKMIYFKEFMNVKYPDYNRDIYFLKHDSKLLSSSYENILGFSVNNKSLYRNKDLDIYETLEKVNKMTKALTGRKLMQAMDLKLIVKEKERQLLKKKEGEIISIEKNVEIYLIELIELLKK
ncbi:hypothetical protein VSU16_03000 [Cetobacterium somerae]|uniref:KGGVGR-motif variant AAA ATPase n=1 Tax=Cetobacterium somerae TaxID=188913 RepID=UPI002E7AF01D|nr:hypothetical protein [Cetobacterium somerae]WVJ01709.1 hypothetical protein VSU16_03000 [Cetobacterium somerae]